MHIPWLTHSRVTVDGKCPMQAFGRNEMISSAVKQGVVSDEFATGNGLVSSTAPVILSLCPAGA
jgi:hypothetical protein